MPNPRRTYIVRAPRFDLSDGIKFFSLEDAFSNVSAHSTPEGAEAARCEAAAQILFNQAHSSDPQRELSHIHHPEEPLSYMLDDEAYEKLSAILDTTGVDKDDSANFYKVFANITMEQARAVVAALPHPYNPLQVDSMPLDQPLGNLMHLSFG